MIECPVCKAQNHHLAVTCSSCNSYIQRKVDNIDLFDTLWSLIESPGKAFHNIAVATHKNYALLLSAFAGIWQIFWIFRLIEAAEVGGQFLNILVAGFAIGPFIGIAAVLLFSGFTRLVLRLLGEKVSFRNIIAVAAYSQLPIVLMTVFLVPLELMTWGVYFFTRTSSAFQLYPTSYLVVMIMNAAGGAWSVSLFIIGIRKLINSGTMRAFALGACALVLFGGAASIGIQILKKL